MRASASVSTIRVMHTGGAAAMLQLVVEEAEIEAGIVRDERRIADEFEQFLDLVGEARLVRQEDVALSPWTASASLGIGRSGLK